MEDGINHSEHSDPNKKILDSFFSDLSEEQTQPHMIEASELNRLLERGVTIEDLCHEFVRRGFLLHGTGRLITYSLEPRQARDESGHPDNVKNAVYASDDPRVPLFMSLVSGLPGRSRYSITTEILEDKREIESAVFETSHEISADKIGYIYVLPKETFEPAGHGQFTSDVPVVPQYIVPITISDFPYSISRLETN